MGKMIPVRTVLFPIRKNWVQCKESGLHSIIEDIRQEPSSDIVLEIVVHQNRKPKMLKRKILGRMIVNLFQEYFDGRTAIMTNDGKYTIGFVSNSVTVNDAHERVYHITDSETLYVMWLMAFGVDAKSGRSAKQSIEKKMPKGFLDSVRGV